MGCLKNHYVSSDYVLLFFFNQICVHVHRVTASVMYNWKVRKLFKAALLLIYIQEVLGSVVSWYVGGLDGGFHWFSSFPSSTAQ
jgi:hypothetical protein